MSKNVSNGFVFKTTDLMEIHNTIDEFRKQLQPLVYDKTAQYFADECTARYDYNTIDNKKSHGIFNEIYQQFIQKQDEVRVKAVRDPSVDFQFNIIVIPTKDKFYGLFYTEQVDFVNLWTENDLVDEYIYYNHQDRPDTFTEDEWKEREAKWGELLDPAGGIPALAGFTYSVIQEQTVVVPKIKDVISKIPSIANRTELCARDKMFKRFAKDKKFSDNNVIKLYGEFVEYLDTDEGKKKYDDEIGRMSSQLKIILTEQELM